MNKTDLTTKYSIICEKNVLEASSKVINFCTIGNQMNLQMQNWKVDLFEHFVIITTRSKYRAASTTILKHNLDHLTDGMFWKDIYLL